jgi:importin subunit beta-1
MSRLSPLPFSLSIPVLIPIPIYRPSSHYLHSYRLLQDSARQAEYSTRWLALDVKIRGEIKTLVLRGLNSEQVKAGTVAAQSVAAIATVELPQGQWPDLIEILLRFVNTGTSVPLRQSTLSAIGFICEALVRPLFFL